MAQVFWPSKINLHLNFTLCLTCGFWTNWFRNILFFCFLLYSFLSFLFLSFFPCLFFFLPLSSQPSFLHGTVSSELMGNDCCDCSFVTSHTSVCKWLFSPVYLQCAWIGFISGCYFSGAPHYVGGEIKYWIWAQSADCNLRVFTSKSGEQCRN